MEIILGQEAGFCFGVKRAGEMALKHAKEGRVLTYGPLIHNPAYLKYLSEQGVEVMTGLGAVRDCKTLIIRAHGVSRELEAQMRRIEGIKVEDATCVFVKKVQRLAERLSKEGYEIFLLGDELHPEVVGIVSYAPKNIHVIKEIKDIRKDLLGGKVALISQTTQDETRFEEIADYLKKKNPDVLVHNTICGSTERKQKEAKEIAGKVDLMIIVGGKESSNTNRLREICEPIVKTYLVENAKEIEKDWFAGVESVGITAGASTPDFSIEEVVKKIKDINEKRI